MSGWLDGLAHEPGRNAGYAAGRNSMSFCGIHFTAGACGGDRSVGLNGYFTFYVPKGPGCGPGATQFCEVDAKAWHMCEWNGAGPGIEFEKLNGDEPTTPYQLEMGGLIIRQLVARGIAPTYRDTPGDRIPVGAGIGGFVSHRSVHENACDEHFDWLPAGDMAVMLAGGGAPAPPKPKWFEEEPSRARS